MYNAMHAQTTDIQNMIKQRRAEGPYFSFYHVTQIYNRKVTPASGEYRQVF